MDKIRLIIFSLVLISFITLWFWILLWTDWGKLQDINHRRLAKLLAFLLNKPLFLLQFSDKLYCFFTSTMHIFCDILDGADDVCILRYNREQHSGYCFPDTNPMCSSSSRQDPSPTLLSGWQIQSDPRYVSLSLPEDCIHSSALEPPLAINCSMYLPISFGTGGKESPRFFQRLKLRLRTYCQAMLASPVSTPAEAINRLHLQITVRTKTDHHTWTGIDALAASSVICSALYLRMARLFLINPNNSVISVFSCHLYPAWIHFFVKVRTFLIPGHLFVTVGKGCTLFAIQPWITYYWMPLAVPMK